MKNRENDEDVQRLHAAEAERDEVKRQGVKLTPLLTRLHRHASDNAFAERLVAALVEQSIRRQS